MPNDLYESRMEICKKCPLFKETELYGPVCNGSKYLNKYDKTSVSNFPRKDYIRGCGCKLKFKCKNPKVHCIVEK